MNEVKLALRKGDVLSPDAGLCRAWNLFNPDETESSDVRAGRLKCAL
jgi:hypothetical protein